MAKRALKLVPAPPAHGEPPRPLGVQGLDLWRRIQSEYAIRDTGGMELLTQACQGLDRAEELAARIAKDGAVIQGRFGPQAHPALKAEMEARAFVCRTLQRLGLNLEPVKRPGRPGSVAGWVPTP